MREHQPRHDFVNNSMWPNFVPGWNRSIRVYGSSPDLISSNVSNPFFSRDTGGPKVYDVTSYLDDHPGGAEVMLDLAGKNADEFFEDIGHSQDARNELKKYLIGTYEMTEEELEQMRIAAANKVNAGGSSPIMILLVVLVAMIYAYTQDYF